MKSTNTFCLAGPEKGVRGRAPWGIRGWFVSISPRNHPIRPRNVRPGWLCGAFALVLGLSAAAWSLHSRYLLGINATFSMLEPALFVVDRRGWGPGEGPQRGQYVALRWKGGGPWPAGAIFVKRVVGIPADEVTVVDRVVLINGEPIAYAKPNARNGEPLEPIAPQRIPDGHYYLHNDGPDSLDSRYALAGLLPQSSLMGSVAVWKFSKNGLGKIFGVPV